MNGQEMAKQIREKSNYKITKIIQTNKTKTYSLWNQRAEILIGYLRQIERRKTRISSSIFHSSTVRYIYKLYAIVLAKSGSGYIGFFARTLVYKILLSKARIFIIILIRKDCSNLLAEGQDKMYSNVFESKAPGKVAISASTALALLIDDRNPNGSITRLVA